MVDRPFMRGARFTDGSPIVNAANPDFANLVQLVRVGDIPSEDAALVEDLFVVSNEGYPDDGGIYSAAFGLYIYAPNQAAPATSFPMLWGKFEVGLSGNTNLLRPLQLGKMEGMYLEKGYILAVGYLGAGPNSVSGSLSPSGLTWFAQGGFY